jgi:hypothetical protein
MLQKANANDLPAREERPMSSLKSFFLVVGFVVLIATALLLVREQEPIQPASVPKQGMGLEIQFAELRQTALRAVKTRDASLLPRIFVVDSPAYERARSEIQRLTRDGVLDRSRFELVRFAILSQSSTKATVEEVAHVFPCFKSEEGKNLTVGNTSVAQTGIWHLALLDDGWRIEDVELTDDHALDSSYEACS